MQNSGMNAQNSAICGKPPHEAAFVLNPHQSGQGTIRRSYCAGFESK
jgi:hypothetical protein